MSCGAEELLSEIPSPENEKLLAARLSAASCIYKCGGRVLGRAAKENKKVEMRKEARRDPDAVPPQPLLVHLWIWKHCLRDLSGVHAVLLWMQIVIMLLFDCEKKKKKLKFKGQADYKLQPTAGRQSKSPVVNHFINY